MPVISGEADSLSELQAIEKELEELEELQPLEHQEQGLSSNISNFLFKHLIRRREVVEVVV